MVGFWAHARASPGRVVVIDSDGTEVLAGRLLAATNQVVHGLRSRGVDRGDVVMVMMRNRVEHVELNLAVRQAGMYFVPINPKSTASELAYLLQDSEAAAFVFEAVHADAVRRAIELSRSPAVVCSVGEAAGFTTYTDLKRGQPTTDPPERSAGEPMLYTSGTTGQPRAVVRPLRDCTPEERAEAAIAHLGAMAAIEPDSGAIHIVASPLYHSASLLWCTDHLHLGHRVVLVDRWSPEGMLDAIARHGATGSFMVPTHFHRLLALDPATARRYDVSSLRHVVHAGAPCPIEVKRRMLAWWGPVIYEVYGATEGGAAAIGPDEWLAHPGSVGKAGPNMRILRDDGTPCAPGEPGIVYLDRVEASPFVYRNDPDKTASGRRDGYFTVGDVGYVDPDGYLFLCDRRQDVIISGGFKVYPAEVETVLIGHPAVKDVAVFGIPDDEWGENVKAVVELWSVDLRTPELAPALIAFCRERLAAPKCPRSIDFVAELPRDANGKLYKRQLREPYWADRGRVI